MGPKQLLIQSFEAAVAAADPLKILPNHLPAPPSGKTLVIGAGKAAASMALAVERHWPAGAALEGLVITRHGHGLPTRRIKVIEAGHPVPDESGESAAKEILQRVGRLAPGDLLLALISGGGSALLSLPVEAVGMEALKATTRELLRSGAPRRPRRRCSRSSYRTSPATIPRTSPPVPARRTPRRTATRSRSSIATASRRSRRSGNTSSGAPAAKSRKHPNPGTRFFPAWKTA